MLKEVDWGDKSNCTSCGCPMANWHESLLSEVDWGAHHSSVFLFLVNIDYDAKPNEFFIQGLWGEPQHRTPYIPLIGLQTDSLATGQSFSNHGSSTTMVCNSGETCHPCTSHYLVQAYGGIILIYISSKTTPHSSFHHLHTHTHTHKLYISLHIIMHVSTRTCYIHHKRGVTEV